MSLELYYIRQTVTECRAKEVVRLEKAKSENDLVVQGIAGGAKLAYEDVLRRIETPPWTDQERARNN